MTRAFRLFPFFWPFFRPFFKQVLLLALFLAVGPSASASWNDGQPDLFVYRWRQGPPPEFALKAHKITLGLSEKQITALRDLTAGEVDFSGLYSVRATTPDEALIQQAGLIDQIVSGAPPPFFEQSLVDPDPELKGQWWIDQLHVPEAWLLATGQGITIVDCDAGFYIDENDLKANLLLEHRYSMTNETDRLNVGAGNYVYHGTAVAAILAGVLNSAGTNGIAFNSKIIPIQNYTYDTSIDKMDKEEATAQCILRAIAIPGVRIIQLENQTHGSSETFAGTREAVRLALKAGITIVSAAGNSGHELKDEAADDTGSIIVGAVNMNDFKTVFSNYGSRVVIAGYGEYLKTLFGPDGKTGFFGGTSGAAPQVSAAVAMMLEVNPELTPDIIKEILQNTRVTADKNATVGGRLDIFAAVQEAQRRQTDQRKSAQARHFRARATRILLGPP